MTTPCLDAMDDAARWLALAAGSAVPATTLDCLYKAVVAITRAIHKIEEEREAHERERKG